MRKHLRLIAPLVAVLGLVLGNCGAGFSSPSNQPNAGTPGGTAIVNAISATYSDTSGAVYSTVSNTVQTTVAMIGAIVVSPKQTTQNPATDAVPAGSVAMRTFVISNTSNITDAYTITAASAGPAAIASIAYETPGGPVPVTVGSTVSPDVAPGGTMRVVVAVATAGLAVGTAIPVALSARTTVTGTANGLQTDSGTQWIVLAVGPSLVGPGGASTKISKTVDRTTSVQSQPGASVTFDIMAMNDGGSPATNVVVTDKIPAGLTADVGSVKIDGTPAGGAATLSNGTLVVKVPSLAAGATLDVSFVCTVLDAQTSGLTFVNIATVGADGLPSQPTTPASVLSGSADIVYDGYAGAGSPVGGATVTLLDEAGVPVKLSSAWHSRAPSSSTAPTANAQNPFVTGPDGSYSFDLDPAAIGSGRRFLLTISAPQYLNRRIQLDLVPGVGEPLYDVTATSLDGQPLAAAGGFSLTRSAASLQNVFGFFGNLPLFTAGTLTVTKSVDRQVAQPGDRLSYTIDVRNTTPSAIGSTQIVDTLPAGLSYAPGTAKLDGASSEPQVNGRTLTWTLSDVAPSSDHTLTYICVVSPSAPSGTDLVNTVVATGAIPGTTLTTDGRASASVQIVGGAFSQRQIVTGRVFADAMHDGRFHRGDTGLAGVRVFLEDGSSVVTDGAGRFTFPGVRPGMHVLRVDPTTLPSGVRAYDGYPMTSSRSPQQLVHGILDDGLMEDVEFAMQTS